MILSSRFAVRETPVLSSGNSVELSTSPEETNNNNKIGKFASEVIDTTGGQSFNGSGNNAEKSSSSAAKKRNKRSKRKGPKLPLSTQTSSGSSADASCNEAGSLEGSGEHSNSADQSPEVVPTAPAFEVSADDKQSPEVGEDSEVSELERQLAEACMDEDRRDRSSDEEPFFVLEEAPGTGILVSIQSSSFVAWL